MKRLAMGLALLASAAGVQAQMRSEVVSYQIDGQPFEGRLVWDDAIKQPRPGLMMVPNWLGVTDQAVEKAMKVAGERYVVFVADLYGRDIRPANAEEAAKAAGAVRGDRPLMRKRAQAAVQVLHEHGAQAGLDDQRVAAIGFCFGGGSVLELARSGAPLAAFVSFHGNLDTPDPADARNIKAPVLVLTGADDPSVPQSQVDAFVAEMKGAGALDWQLVSYGGAVHSFTDPYAKVPGRNEYNPKVARRAFQAMDELLAEVF